MIFGPDFAMWRDLLFGIGAAVLFIAAIIAAVMTWWNGRK